MKNTLLLLLICCVLAIQVKAQSYDISFSVSGQSVVPDNVKVTNLGTNESVMLNGDDVLRLNVGTLGIDDDKLQNNSLKVYPNPVKQTAIVEYNSPTNEKVPVKLYDVLGRLLISKTVVFNVGYNSILLKGLGIGTYVLNIQSPFKKLSTTIISKSNEAFNPSFNFISTAKTITGVPQSFSNKATITMNYEAGSQLRFVASWNGAKSILNLVATQNQTLQFNFTPETVTDIDGNVYATVNIGSQTWMAENLKVTRYANGTAIPLITSNSDWINLGENDTDRGFCYYNNNANNEANTYGALYNYAAATNGNNSGNNVQGVCPNGWHLPSDDEWKTLEIALGMSASDANDTSWRGTNQGAQLAGNASLWNNGVLENNASFGSSNFNAIPSGSRYDYDGSFNNLGIHGYWWSSTQTDGSNAQARRIDYNASTVFRFDHIKSYGICVRCVKN